MKNLFILSTPPHYYNLLQYIEQFDVVKKDSELVFFSSFFTTDDMIDDFIENHINKNDWKSVRRISLWQTKFQKIYSPSNLLKIFFFLKKLLLFYSFRSYNHLVVNQLDQLYSKFFYFFTSYQKVISLDEGNDVFRTIEDRYNRKKSNFFMPKKIIFFSSYNIKVQQPDILVKCQNLYSKKIIKNRQINDNEIFFIGSPYIEDSLIKKSVYFSYLDIIKRDFENKKIKYFPHRRENHNNLIFLKENYNFSIQEIDLPIEFYFLRLEKSPKIILGFLTHALLGLKKLSNKDTLVRSYYIDSNQLESSSDELIQIKNEYQEAGIEVVDLKV
tara:strand:- start:17387 stop:18373 length:987 start_codon:yes stop_codon:yes gene_type:complete